MSHSDQDYEDIFVRSLIQRTESGEIKWRHVSAHGMFITTVGNLTIAVTKRHLTDKNSDFKAGLGNLAKRERQEGALMEAVVRGIWGLAQALGTIMYLVNAEAEVISVESPDVNSLHKLLTDRSPSLSFFKEEFAHHIAKQALLANTLSELGWLPALTDDEPKQALDKEIAT